MMKRIQLAIIVPLSFLMLSASSAIFADESRQLVAQWFEKMSAALREQNYSGLFTYEIGGGLDTYEVAHFVEEGIEHERLHKLNGAPREVLRKGQRTRCLSRGDQMLRRLSINFENQLPPHYFFSISENHRVAGREAIHIEVKSQDASRYSYIFALDKESALPVQMLVITPESKVIERIQFAKLDLSTQAAKELVNAEYRDHHTARDDRGKCDSELHLQPAGWQATWLPSGFEYGGYRISSRGDRMLAFTDGFASISVFIVHDGERVPIKKGRAQLGATNAAVSQRVWDNQLYSISVVGEVPYATAQQVAERIEKSVAQ
ncbi:MucB/RseB C-terminal domain-containing protein [Aurantivibrio plasticivorans]